MAAVRKCVVTVLNIHLRNPTFLAGEHSAV